MKLHGIHVPHKKNTAQLPPVRLEPPKTVAIPMSMHIGRPAKPVVKRGDEVRVGTLIAEADGYISAPIHSSVSGKVQKIDEITIMNGAKVPCILIDSDGMQTPDDSITPPKVHDLESFIDAVKNSGSVGLGGAGFPTFVKFVTKDLSVFKYVIINAAECEPYITSDTRTMLDRTDSILRGIEAMKKYLGVKNFIIGIENNKPEAIAKMQEMAKQFEGIIVEPLKVKYPQGAEKQLINAVTGRKVPSGKLPIDVGCVVSNLGTAFSVYEAIQKNKPLIENILTVTGKKLPSQHNCQVRIGTTYNDIIKHTIGELPASTGKVISGGTMMGKAVVNLDAPTVKGNSSVLVMDEAEARRNPETACIRCGKCMHACPMGLEPYMFSALVRNNRIEEAKEHNILDCIECGCCFFSCPANKPLTDEIRLGKNKVRAMMAAKK